MNRISSIFDKTIEYSFYLLFFLVPLILTPWNYELFEFNKMMLTYFLTTIIVAAWLVKMVIQRTILFRRTILDFPLILFLTSQLISTFLSVDRHTSLWGYYSRFNGGLLSLIAYLLLYWAFVSNMNKPKTLRCMFYVLCSAALIAAYGIAEHFGIDAKYWVQDVQSRVFSTLGQPNWLAAWLVALLPLGFAFALEQESRKARKQERKNLKLLLFYSFTLLLYLCLLYTKSRSGLLGFVFAYAVFWGLIFLRPNLTQIKTIVKKCAKSFLIITSLILLISILVGSPWTPSAGEVIKKFRPQPTPKPEATVSAEPTPLITDSGDIRKIVWQGAIEIWKHYPVFGTGVETFAYSYYWHRPRAHNDVSEWDFLYNKAHNEYLTILANTGIIGLGSYLLVIGTFISWSIKEIKKLRKLEIEGGKASDISISQYLSISLLAGYSSILITNFFGFSVVPVNLLFFLYPGFVFVLAQEEQGIKSMVHKTKELSLNWLQKISILFFGLWAMYFLLRLGLFWYADTRFAVAEKLNDSAWYERAYNELQTAISLHPNEPYYHQEIAYSLAGMATLTEESTVSAQLADLAIAESDQALKISPYHLDFWQKRAKMLILLSSVDPKYQLKALDTLLKASELAPTNAKIFYNLGILYSHLDQNETAIETLEKAISLKPNYSQARYALALLYEKKGKIEEAKEQLEYILEKINPADTRAKGKLEEL